MSESYRPLTSTLGEAVAFLRPTEPWACGCVGGINCCARRIERAHALKRGAHIVARQLADLAARREETP